MASTDDSSISYPREASVFSHRNVETVLKADKGEDARLVSFSVHEFTNKGDHYVTLVSAVHVEFTLNGGDTEAVSYIAKYNPERLKVMEEFASAVFIKEELFYRHVVREIQAELEAVGQPPLRVPKYFHSSLEEGEQVIFLEDLRPRGFRMFDRKKGMDAAHTKLVLEELARLHAASHLLKARIPDLTEKYPALNIDWLNYGANARQTTQDLFAHQMDSAAQVLRGVEGYKEAEAWLLKNKSRAADMLEEELRRDPPFDLLCHGDCWNNNILFRYSDEGLPVEVMLIDLQMSRVASLATDLNYLLHTSLQGDVREQNLTTFLADYHASFSHLMKAAARENPFSLAELTQEYVAHLQYGLMLGLFAVIFVVSEDEDVIDPEDQTEFQQNMKDLLVKMMANNPNMRNRLLCLFDEMIKYDIIS